MQRRFVAASLLCRDDASKEPGAVGSWREKVVIDVGNDGQLVARVELAQGLDGIGNGAVGQDCGSE